MAQKIWTTLPPCLWACLHSFVFIGVLGQQASNHTSFIN